MTYFQKLLLASVKDMWTSGKVYTVHFIFRRNVKETNEIIWFLFWCDLRLKISLITKEGIHNRSVSLILKCASFPLKIDLGKSHQDTISHSPCFPDLPGNFWADLSFYHACLMLVIWCLCVCASVGVFIVYLPCVVLQKWIHSVN